MKLLATTDDPKISASNHLLEMTIGEYAPIGSDILRNNDLQRRRVKTANRTYGLLKEDIKFGCVIPPIVLAIFPNEKQAAEINNAKTLLEKISTAGKDLIILDGLQRTYTILDLLNEINDNKEMVEKVSQLPLRIEIYTGISKVGVLYRMLTLNTGQTPMSTRHQVEMIYSDYKNGFDGLTFITEAQNKVPTGDNEFRFNDILDGFISYITGDYLPLDREDLVEIIKNLEALTKDDKKKDLFKQLITTYNHMRLRLLELSPGWQYQTDDSLRKRPFGTNVNDIFSKVQTIAGFGAALNFLIENALVVDLDAVPILIAAIEPDGAAEAFDLMIKHLDEIQVSAKKIGNEQRMYFYYFFRSIFNETNDGYLRIDKSVSQANKFYKANMLG